MPRRHHAIVATLCLSTVALLSAGCADEEKATPQVIFEAQLGHGVGTNCRDIAEVFKVGDFGTPALDEKPKPIKDGETWEQGAVGIACSVIQSGDEFLVEASLALSGATGGLFRVDGKFKAGGEQTNIHAVFTSRRSGNSYEQQDRACIVRYTTVDQGVAAGRVWGEITCPSVFNSNAETTCEATAQFRFENCTQ
jgi:hypothetical protein